MQGGQFTEIARYRTHAYGSKNWNCKHDLFCSRNDINGEYSLIHFLSFDSNRLKITPITYIALIQLELCEIINNFDIILLNDTVINIIQLLCYRKLTVSHV